MKHEIKAKSTGDNWQEGTIDGIPYQAKVYEEPSENYGIRKGNVSKLWIKGICNYDRGWDNRPETPEGRSMVNALVAFFKKPENCKINQYYGGKEKMRNFAITFHAYDEKDRECESCFTVSVSENLTEKERSDLFIKIAPDMARLQGLRGQNVTVALIEEDN